MSDKSEFKPELPMYLKRTETEIEKEADPTTEWYELLCEEWEQLLHNGTFGWQEAAQFLGYKIEDISTNNELDKTKLFDFFIDRAFELALLEGPDKRYILDYEPFPEGKGLGLEKEESQGNDEQEKKDFAYRTIYLKELLTHLGFAYSLASTDQETVDSHKHLEDHLESKIVWQFYIYNLKKAVFVSNQPKHATIIVHNVFEEEVKPIAKNVTRIEVQDVDGQPFISRVFWVRAETLEQEKNIWQEKMKVELSRMTIEEKQGGLIHNHAHTREIDNGDMEKYGDIEIIDAPNPDGWMMIPQISDQLTRTRDWITPRIDIILSSGSDDLQPKKYRNLRNHNIYAVFFPPKLIVELVRLAEKEQFPPEGWKVVGEKKYPESISYLLKRNKDWVTLRIKDLVVGHPGWEHKLYLGRNNELLPHYPPELIAELVRLAEQEENPPEGWKVVGNRKLPKSIAFLVQRDKDWVNVRIIQLINEYPEWESKLYLGRNNELFPHYPPELVDFLYKLKTKEEEYFKNGWSYIGQYTEKSSSGISGKFKKNRAWVKKYLDLFLAGRPDMAETIGEVNKYNSKSLLYPPEAVAYLESIAGNN